MWARLSRVGVLIVLVLVWVQQSTAQAHLVKPLTASPIQHVVFIVKENHTFDQMFGLFPGANGTSVGFVKINGVQTQIALNAGQDRPANYAHGWSSAHKAYDKGAMNAFNLAASNCGTPPYLCYQELSQSQIPNYWTYAQNYVLNDNTFSSLTGPSFPNHQYAIAGGSGSDIQHSAIANPSAKPWGCTSASTNTVQLFNGSFVYPCFTYSNLADEMTSAGVSWKYYAHEMRNELTASSQC
jgi:phospholipase C